MSTSGLTSPAPASEQTRSGTAARIASSVFLPAVVGGGAALADIALIGVLAWPISLRGWVRCMCLALSTTHELLSRLKQLGSSSNVLATSKSHLDASDYGALGASFLSGANPDYTEAAKWFRKAAEMGDPQAQTVLGVLHWTGRGVPRNAVTAVRWFRKAADRGEAQAMRNLSLAYESGVGIERSAEEAVRWLRRAAETGDAEAQTLLGKACYEGVRVPKDRTEALFWLMLAAETNAVPSGVVEREARRVSVLREARPLLKEVELFASPEEMAEAKARVERFKAKQDSASGAQQRLPAH